MIHWSSNETGLKTENNSTFTVKLMKKISNNANNKIEEKDINNNNDTKNKEKNINKLLDNEGSEEDYIKKIIQIIYLQN